MSDQYAKRLKIARRWSPEMTPGERERLARQVHCARRFKRSQVISGDLPVRLKPFKHQVRAFRIGMALDAAALLMEQRTGKTLSAIAIAGARYQKGQVRRVVIGMPLSVTDVWEQAFEDVAKFKYELVVVSTDEVYDVKRVDELFKHPSRLQVLIINYESLWRVVNQLKRWKPDMVILDESQRIKRRAALQSRGCHRLGKISKYKLILTGTPIGKNPIDLYSQYLFLNSAIFGKRLADFKKRFVIMGGYCNYKIVGYRHLKLLSRLAHSIAYRVTRKQVFDMPPEVDQYLYVHLKKSRRIYKELEKNFFTTVGGESVSTPLIITQLLRLQQITGGFLKTDESDEFVHVGNEKLGELEAFLEGYPSHQKIVIFARFIPEIKAISRLMSKLDINHWCFTGRTNKDKITRKRMLRAFQEKKNPRALVVQIQTGGLGRDFTRASTAVFYSKNFSYLDYDQARARLLGPNQKYSVNFIHLIAKGTIEESCIQPALKEKRDIAELVIDKLNPFTRLHKEIIMPKVSKKVPKSKEGVVSGVQKSKAASKAETSEDIEEVVRKLDRETADHSSTATATKEVHVMSKKADKKSSKKHEEKPAKKEVENAVTLADIAKSEKVDARELRVALRASKIKKPGGSWSWPKGHADIKTVEKLAGSLGK